VSTLDRRPAPTPTPAELYRITGTPHESAAKERGFRGLLLASLLVGVIFLAILLVYVLYEGFPRLDASLLLQQLSSRPARAGAQAAVIGSIYLVVLVASICLPIGIAAAVYLEEYANRQRWWNRLVELNIQNLAAVPSVVYGILGLGIISRGIGLGPTLVTGAITLALLVLPVIIIASREAIRSVPDTIRQGSLALGATRWQTVRRQVLPSAVPGMATGSILALSRAIGEAAPLVILGIPTFIASNPDSLTDRFTAMPVVIYYWAGQAQEDWRVLASALIVVLLVVLLAMNATAIFIRNRSQLRW
jgi:phosphate transport system permease protein